MKIKNNLNIGTIDSLGYSKLDWEYAKKKSEDPTIRFEDVLKESVQKLRDNGTENDNTVPGCQ